MLLLSPLTPPVEEKDQQRWVFAQPRYDNTAVPQQMARVATQPIMQHLVQQHPPAQRLAHPLEAQQTAAPQYPVMPPRRTPYARNVQPQQRQRAQAQHASQVPLLLPQLHTQPVQVARPPTSLATNMPSPVPSIMPWAPTSPLKRRRPAAKALWSVEENIQFFRTIAEYIHVGPDGMHPLIMHLNPQELAQIEMCESSPNNKMTDQDIATVLGRGGHKSAARNSGELFRVLRHVQQASGNHSIREVNVKLRSIRSRIISWFMTIFVDGDHAVRRSSCYLNAILYNLLASPHCPVMNMDPLQSAKLRIPDPKTDASLWLQSMFWLRPKPMYEFVYKCAVRVTRSHAENTKAKRRTALQNHLANEEEPRVWVVFEYLKLLVNSLYNNKPEETVETVGAAESCFFASTDPKKQPLEYRKRVKGLSTRNPVAKMAMSTLCQAPEDKIELIERNIIRTLIGYRVKLIAAVGGVIRSTNNMLDIKYHLYRLWTCVAWFADTTEMLAKNKFDEFVVVDGFADSFDESTVEPQIRASLTREPATNIAEQIAKAVNSSGEVPVWLTVTMNSEGGQCLALLVCSRGATEKIPFHRRFTDQELSPIINNMLTQGGAPTINNNPVNSISGLEPWPSSHNTLMSHGICKRVTVKTKASILAVNSSYTHTTDILQPWCEPRVMSSVAFALQLKYAAVNSKGYAPSFIQLTKEDCPLKHVGATQGSARQK
ncbi:hypothetical protein GGI25_000624 [Coemansia spiralis]|uniref:Uncharacterized protein n=2 Tax=Coemansia TaxID=4863 RepID=A0A9W8GE58_9FUNG|nr:hypothetical protein GGI26_000664 [Coemansia sp. RSA 1358]KAJ2680651.1 hypothetical protein GGI25_000624 [Coemansia spiralis]